MNIRHMTVTNTDFEDIQPLVNFSSFRGESRLFSTKMCNLAVSRFRRHLVNISKLFAAIYFDWTFGMVAKEFHPAQLMHKNGCILYIP